MLRLRIVSAALLASAAFIMPAMAADEPATPGFKLLRSEELLTENHEPMPAAGVKLGDMDLVFEKTSLEDIKKIYGGEIATFNGENKGIDWLCYAVPAADGNPDMLVWFAADGIMSTNYGVNFVVAEMAPAGATATCAAPTKPLELRTALPPVAGTSTDVVAVFGGEAKDDGVMSYGGAMPAAPELKLPAEAATGVTMNFQIVGGAITAVTISQVTSM